MFTAEEYRRSAELLREHGHDNDELADEWASRAQRMEHLAVLIQQSVDDVKTYINSQPDPYSLPHNEWPMRLAARLMATGWTPPEGLF